MTIDELLQQARRIWGDQHLTLEEILVRLGVTVGDVHRLARTQAETGTLDEAELQKELGNLIFSVIRWASDLGYNPEECIELAKQAQQQYQDKLAR